VCLYVWDYEYLAHSTRLFNVLFLVFPEVLSSRWDLFLISQLKVIYLLFENSLMKIEEVFLFVYKNF